MQREMIGETIRKFRAERKLSREMLAEQTGIYIIIPLTFPILQAFPPVH